jgi:lysozyme
MELSVAGLAILKQSEGFRGRTYRDAEGIPTIGYGHKLLPRESYPSGITEAEATVILSRDLALSEGSISRLARVPLTQGQFDALVDFVFNLGQGRLESSTLLKDLNAKQYDAAAAQLLQWDHAGAKELTALKARRAAEYQLWTGHTPAK